LSWDIPEPWDQFPPSQKWFAGGEALAHLKYLEEEGKILRQIKECFYQVIEWRRRI
jgi:hypothetical protein